MTIEVDYRWRGAISDAELVALTDSYGGNSMAGWWDRVRPRSLGWVAARAADGSAVGFVNVAWDGSDHAFLIDTKVRVDQQHRGIGTELVRIAAHHVHAPRDASGSTSTSKTGWRPSTSTRAGSRPRARD